MWCCSDLCYFTCGCKSTPKKIDTPEGYPEPPKKILCPYCGTMADSEYRYDKYAFHICYISCIPCGSSSPYLACSSCRRNLGSIGDYRCHKCDVATTFDSNNCPNCGEEKGQSGGGYRRLNLK
ncbi:hypothetical protein [Encephalitozoon cuniculi GB-M1]|uniref:Zinc-ribbon 15 domain-containing protein n=2 Tax=Encephalitozoon cuniculi TaxID=6035 RepID=Q8SVM9_ENCCU|nr:uncharacterized protein ECU05_0200 [Encephalitozoon cuniculi GB-M1]AGE95486.1 hypothetical protein ECU05_0200 [Encephalitozoon cuniculi]KMV66072.1 hypothetical protein M970_050130 [Encephalitozoon cuniculi EcunIII-L]UYI27806.1 zinc-ribbon-like protein [Encephalitozoon cuniculi]CAD26536.1 hypothetical protein [Encephalitozoon cuniculi GB-M1]